MVGLRMAAVSRCLFAGRMLFPMSDEFADLPHEVVMRFVRFVLGFMDWLYGFCERFVLHSSDTELLRGPRDGKSENYANGQPLRSRFHDLGTF